MKIQVYHAVYPTFRAWAPTALMRKVDEWEPITDPLSDNPEVPSNILELVWTDHNAVSGTERCCQLRIRSLSVGDVVQLDDRAFACESIGWVEIKPEQMRLLVSN